MPELTRRQRIQALLEDQEWSFDELREHLATSVRLLEDDLKHLWKSNRGRTRVEPACCRECGFVFRDREPRHFARPGRCPRCRSSPVEPAGLSLK